MIRKMCLLFVLATVFGGTMVSEDDPVVLSYRRNFVRAGIATKADILNDAAKITTINMTPLYRDALLFSLSVRELLGSDTQFLEMTAASLNRVSAYRDNTVIPVIKDVFFAFDEPQIRLSCLSAITEFSRHHPVDPAFFNEWLTVAISSQSRRSASEIRVLTACAATLGAIGSPSSFNILFQAAVSEIDSALIDAASRAINLISDQYLENMLAIISSDRLQYSYSGFGIAMKNTNLSSTAKGRIAEAAFAAATDRMSVSVEKSSPHSPSELLVANRLIRDSLAVMTELRWSQASPRVVRYFYQAQADYKNGVIALDTLIPVIRALGAMGTTDAAGALSIFLGLINAETEERKTYNEQLLLAVIGALGDLGDKTSFDYLLYVGYLDYPETVKEAARAALARLKW